MVGQRIEGFARGYGFGMIKPQGGAIVASHGALDPRMGEWLLISYYIEELADKYIVEIKITKTNVGKKITHWHRLGTIFPYGVATETNGIEVEDKKDRYIVTLYGGKRIQDVKLPKEMQGIVKIEKPFEKVGITLSRVFPTGFIGSAGVIRREEIPKRVEYPRRE